MKDKKLTRRDFLNLSAGAAIGSWLAACSPATPAAEKSAEGAATSAPPAAEQVTITFSG